ncbi:MAG: hypothetical protein K2Z81_01330, partial [Cyanobacteria bacterium]|nr:hypothetical protein [Cyanobacteriota bacterium]
MNKPFQALTCLILLNPLMCEEARGMFHKKENMDQEPKHILAKKDLTFGLSGGLQGGGIKFQNNKEYALIPPAHTSHLSKFEFEVGDKTKEIMMSGLTGDTTGSRLVKRSVKLSGGSQGTELGSFTEYAPVL